MIAIALVLAATAGGGLSGATTRVSVDSSGAQANGMSNDAAISGDAAFVAFHSNAPNLVAGDTNGTYDVFVHDRVGGVTTRVSLGSGGVQANGLSRNPALPHDGSVVAFVSEASNLVAGDTNNRDDVFVHDPQSGTTTRVSVSSVGAQANGNSGRRRARISADGRFVAFDSFATNLVAGDTNTNEDVFVHDRQTGVTSRISVSSGGAQGNGDSNNPDISADGQIVVFHSGASNLVAGDTNGIDDIFVHDRTTGLTTRVSVSTGGGQANGNKNNPELSADGRFAAFHASSTNLVTGDTNGVYDIFVHDRQTATTTRVSRSSGGCQGSNASFVATLSADGRFVAFYSLASNLVQPDGNGADDVYLHDRQTGATTRISVSSGGVQGNGASYRPAISADGLFVAFSSDATNLVTGDTNSAYDIFLRDRTAAGRIRPIRYRPCP